MGRSSQRKGRAAELELCRLLNDHGIPAAVGEPLNYGTEPDISGVAGVHVECKRAERVQIGEWIAQAARDAERLRAAEIILDRGYGKPTQAVDLNASDIPQIVFVGDVPD